MRRGKLSLTRRHIISLWLPHLSSHCIQLLYHSSLQQSAWVRAEGADLPSGQEAVVLNKLPGAIPSLGTFPSQVQASSRLAQLPTLASLFSFTIPVNLIFLINKLQFFLFGFILKVSLLEKIQEEMP